MMKTHTHTHALTRFLLCIYGNGFSVVRKVVLTHILANSFDDKLACESVLVIDSPAMSALAMALYLNVREKLCS